ncbi:hypothetical protein SK128_011418 [Halocaridina rubra]|uniref:Uncharacterized protein n=1 Tax=Halocaridina rubra TaxID=373956 RepID=A0AAN9A6B6_HALRR
MAFLYQGVMEVSSTQLIELYVENSIHISIFYIRKYFQYIYCILSFQCEPVKLSDFV